jgi:hypothetical protein
MIIISGTKKCVHIFKLRHDIDMCIFVCITKHKQISYDLDETPHVLSWGAKPLQWCCCFEIAISPWLLC